MKISQETHGNATLIRLDGKLDVHSTPVVLEVLEGLMAGGVTDMVIDMLKVRFVSSYGLGVLISVNKKAKERGGRVKLANMLPEIKVPFEITGVLPQFEVYESTESALGIS